MALHECVIRECVAVVDIGMVGTKVRDDLITPDVLERRQCNSQRDVLCVILTRIVHHGAILFEGRKTGHTPQGYYLLQTLHAFLVKGRILVHTKRRWNEDAAA